MSNPGYTSKIFKHIIINMIEIESKLEIESRLKLNQN